MMLITPEDSPMRWPLFLIILVITLTAVPVAQTQDNAQQQWCKAACSVALPSAPPPGCDCAEIAQDSDGSDVGSGSSGSTGLPSTDTIAEDGVVSVGELIDYMEQLYRARVAGVQHYYFFERMVVAQSEQGASSVLGSISQGMPSIQGGLTGVNTAIPVVRAFDKVQKDGNPSMKPLTPRERNERSVKNDPEIAARATADEKRAAEALAADPSLFFGALGQVADILAGSGAGDRLREAEAEMRANLGQEEKEAEEDSLAEDILAELLALKQILDAEEAAIAESSSGEAEQINSSVYLGAYRERGEALTFSRGPRCEMHQGCTLEEIGRYVNHRYQLNGDESFSLVWRPTQGAMSALGNSELGANSSGELSLANATGAELWFQISNSLAYMSAQLALTQEGKETASPKQESIDAATTDADRVIRMKVTLANPTNAGFSVQTLDRVYRDFRPVETDAGPPMVEPHLIREQLGNWVCGENIDVADLSLYHIFDGPIEQDTGSGSPEEQCSRNVIPAAVDRIRSRFTYNQGFATAAEEAQAIADELGNIPGLQPQN